MDTNRIKEACEKIVDVLKELATVIRELLGGITNVFKDAIKGVVNPVSYRVYTRQRYSEGQGIRLYRKDIMHRTKVFHCRNNC